MKRLINITIWSILTLAALILFSFVGKKHDAHKCGEFQISVDYSNDIYFLSEAEIKRMVYDEIDYIENLKLSQINIDVLEKLIESNEFVKQADAYSTIEGNIKVNVQQRTPMIRIIDRFNNSFYIDKYGKTMPLKENYSARVLVINGHLDKMGSTSILNEADYTENKNLKLMKDAFTLGKFISESKFWSAMIDQVYVTPEKEFELIPNIGKHVVIFGNIENIEEKFNHLLAFYKEGISMVGWDKYSTVNVKFKNQIVCKKIKSN